MDFLFGLTTGIAAISLIIFLLGFLDEWKSKGESGSFPDFPFPDSAQDSSPEESADAEEAPAKQQLYRLAEQMEPALERAAAPSDLLENEAFTKGAALLASEQFSLEEVLRPW